MPPPVSTEVGVTVQDDDGAAVYSSFQYVVVYDAKGGFVTGGGWINSPAGAYVQNPSLVGKGQLRLRLEVPEGRERADR
jgi:hypothetical protein